jgi:hypothetical protein
VKTALLSVAAFALFRLSVVAGETESWPRQENGQWVTKTLRFRAELLAVAARPTVVPDNLIIKFRILDKSVPADYYWIMYPRYRQKDGKLELILGNAARGTYRLTVDAIAVAPPTDKSFGGSQEFRHDDGSLLVGGLKDIVPDSNSPAKPPTPSE